MIDYFIPLRYRTLLWQFARREVVGRYRGSILGMAWSFVTPLAMLAIYTFVFVHVFKARWGGAATADGGLEFALHVYAGLIVFNLFAEVVTRSPTLIIEQPNLVKKVVFPLHILPWVSILAGLFHLCLNTGVLLAAIAWARGGLPASALALPLVLIVMVPGLLGLSWFLAALGVYVRDVGPLMGMAISGLMFLTPVFYSIQALPEPFRLPMRFNPPTVLIEQSRQVLLDGHWPDWGLLLAYLAASLTVAALGAAWFKLTRRGFADVV